MIKEKIGIIGLGNMGKALARGLKKEKIASFGNILLFDINPPCLDSISRELGFQRALSNQELVAETQVIILAVKPRDVSRVLKETGESWKNDKLIISIAAGVTIPFVEKEIKKELPVIRAMPNIAGQIGAGITAVSAGRLAKPRHMETAKSIFRAFGEVIEVKEAAMDLVTALSGSGPAYFFLIMEALIEAGQGLGLEKPAAEKLVKETALGAAKLAKISSRSPAQLREEVTSPGGTTEAALKVFKEANVRKIIFQAVEAAKNRAEQLSRDKTHPFC